MQTAYVGPAAPDTSRPAFVLLHGFDSSSLEFRRFLPLLSQAADVYAVDLAGWGFTGEHRLIGSGGGAPGMGCPAACRGRSRQKGSPGAAAAGRLGRRLPLTPRPLSLSPAPGAPVPVQTAALAAARAPTSSWVPRRSGRTCVPSCGRWWGGPPRWWAPAWAAQWPSTMPPAIPRTWPGWCSSTRRWAHGGLPGGAPWLAAHWSGGLGWRPAGREPGGWMGSAVVARDSGHAAHPALQLFPASRLPWLARHLTPPHPCAPLPCAGVHRRHRPTGHHAPLPVPAGRQGAALGAAAPGGQPDGLPRQAAVCHRRRHARGPPAHQPAGVDRRKRGLHAGGLGRLGWLAGLGS